MTLPSPEAFDHGTLTVTSVDDYSDAGWNKVTFSDGSKLMMTDAQYDAIHQNGMQFAANLIKRLQS